MLLVPLRVLGQSYIDPNKPVVSCSLAKIAHFPRACPEGPKENPLIFDPDAPVVCCRNEHSAQRFRE